MRDLILAEQTWLVRRVIHYARITGYINYTSSQHIDWEQAIKGLSQSMAVMINLEQPLSEFAPAMDFDLDPVIRFGIEEAEHHRSRGVTLSMFFGMVKYFRRAYTDLVESQNYPAAELYAFRTFIIRFFDHVEMGFLAYWTKQNHNELMDELQVANRRLVQEKSQAEAIANGLYLPVLLITFQGRIVHFNPAAQALIDDKLGLADVPRAVKHWPWLAELLNAYNAQDQPEMVSTLSVNGVNGVVKLNVNCRKVDDLTERFAGLLIVLAEAAD